MIDLRVKIALVTHGNGGIGGASDFITGRAIPVDGGYSTS